MLVYDAVAGALPLLIISERYAFSPKFESECQGGYAAGNALRKYAEGFEMPFSTPAAHARVAGPEQERAALRTVTDSSTRRPSCQIVSNTQRLDICRAKSRSLLIH